MKTSKTKVSKETVLQRTPKQEFVSTKKVRTMLNQVIVLQKN